MLNSLRTFLNRPIAEDFSFGNQLRLALQAGLYVLFFVSLMSGSFRSVTDMGIVALLSVGCVGAVLVANVLIPKALPAFYDEDHWTVGRYIIHTLLVLFLISGSNQLILRGLAIDRPTFGQMYLLVTAIGFFPIMVGVFVAEQRRLKRNLTQAQTLNEQLAHRNEAAAKSPIADSGVTTDTPVAEQAKTILLTSESGKERLSLQPDQVLYVESVGNYVEVHWLHTIQPDRQTAQKTVLRRTLKEVAELLAPYPQLLRCHRAFLVNLRAVAQTEGNARGYQLTLTGSVTKIPVSRSYVEAFDTHMNALL